MFKIMNQPERIPPATISNIEKRGKKFKEIRNGY